MNSLPKLYKKTSTGAIQEWTVSVNGASIVTRFGQVNGALQETCDTLRTGKGKRTAEEQAQAEATSLHEKKLKKGYVESIAAAEAGAVSDVIEGGIFPMLAHRYDQHGHKITWPAYAQPKLDGHRCIAVVKNGATTLWSRTRKQITGLPHVVGAVQALRLRDGAVLDGELYCHEYRDRFEELTSFIRSSEPQRGCEVVEYHIYDVATSGPFEKRTRFLEALVPSRRSTLVRVETAPVSDEDELMLMFERFLAAGYEGAIVRNAAGLYVNKRSYDLLKVKEFVDSEFLCVGIEEGRGKLTGHGIFVCQAKGGLFSAKMIGPLEGLKRYFGRPERAIGKWLTVKYQGMTKYGLPRFPVALRFRDDA